MKSGKTEPYGIITTVILLLYNLFNEEMSHLHHRTEECCRGFHSKTVWSFRCQHNKKCHVNRVKPISMKQSSIYSVLFITSLSTTALSYKSLPQPGHAMTSYHAQGHTKRNILHFTSCLSRTLCLTHNFRLFLSRKWSVSGVCLMAVILSVFKNGRLRIRCCTDKPETLAVCSNGVRLCHLIMQPQIGLSIQHC